MVEKIGRRNGDGYSRSNDNEVRTGMVHKMDNHEKQVKQATKEYNAALNEMDNADADYIETAIYKCNAAAARLNALIKEAKSYGSRRQKASSN